MKKDFSLQDLSGNTIQAYSWIPEGNIKAIVQIVHGMSEHSGRYESFALELNKRSFGVYISDTIGHGKSVKSEEDLGHLPPNGFNIAVENIHLLHEIVVKENKNVPIIIMGHSMGSLLTQSYICKYGNEVNGCILSGTAGKQAQTSFGAFIAKILKTVQGDKKRSKLMEKLSFGNFNNYFKPTKTEFDWLSSDSAEVDKYVQDPLCGFTCTTGFYYELASSVSKLHDKNKVNNIPKNLPIYIFCGNKDPVGGQTKNVLKLISLYKEVGINDLEHKFYKDGRHEMLNETNKEEVITNIVTWLEKRFK